MPELIEVRFHGRGGQGAKTAADLLAITALESGKYIQAFPEYGPERAGAPIRAFTRISDEPINIHCGVTNPEVVVVIDPTLLEAVNVTEGLGDDGVLLANTEDGPEAIRKKINFKGGKVFTVDATKIALDTLGLAIPNTPMLGALIKATGLVSLDDLKEKVKKKFLKKIGEEKTKGNIDALQKAYDEVKEG
ncbi:2-oxoacid:acceptor oxidoreductase family protein [bacterium]|nr:2-oxoacid:acceptor oxidoreductase family protein [bacterium]